MMFETVPGVARARFIAAVGTLVLTLAGCATEPVQPQLGKAESFDGLVEVTNARVGKAWIRPGLNLLGYKKILPVGAGVQYRPAVARGSNRSEFPISAENRAKFEALVSEIFGEELAKSQRFQITTEPGPDVLMVVGSIVDVVSNAAPEPAGRGNVYLSQVGEATLVLELRDSESNAVLARIVDRRAAGRAGGMSWSNTVSNTAEVRRLLSFWASRLVSALDQVPSLTAADD